MNAHGLRFVKNEQGLCQNIVVLFNLCFWTIFLVCIFLCIILSLVVFMEFCFPFCSVIGSPCKVISIKLSLWYPLYYLSPESSIIFKNDAVLYVYDSVIKKDLSFSFLTFPATLW